MIPETEHLQEAKSVCPGKPARHASADPGRYFTQSPQCWFSRWDGSPVTIDTFVQLSAFGSSSSIVSQICSKKSVSVKPLPINISNRGGFG